MNPFSLLTSKKNMVGLRSKLATSLLSAVSHMLSAHQLLVSSALSSSANISHALHSSSAASLSCSWVPASLFYICRRGFGSPWSAQVHLVFLSHSCSYPCCLKLSLQLPKRKDLRTPPSCQTRHQVSTIQHTVLETASHQSSVALSALLTVDVTVYSHPM